MAGILTIQGWPLALAPSTINGVACTRPIYIADGHVEPVPLQTFPPPDFSALSNVTINPGQSLTFDLFSLILPSTVAIGQTGAFNTDLQLDFGRPIYEGWQSSRFTVNLLAGNTFA